MYYFAYGSNLNIKRMDERGVKYIQVIPAKLENYELRFNKVSKKQSAVANVVPKLGSIVEGVLYNVSTLEQMDGFEGYPKHYNRIILKINNVDAWVYIAQPEFTQEGLKPKQEYLNHLLEGKNYMSEEYFQKLKNINEN